MVLILGMYDRLLQSSQIKSYMLENVKKIYFLIEMNISSYMVVALYCCRYHCIENKAHNTNNHSEQTAQVQHNGHGTTTLLVHC